MGEGSPRQRQVAARAGIREGHASFLEVSGNPKTSLCWVSETVEGEGIRSFWFFLPRSQWTDGKVPPQARSPTVCLQKRKYGVGSVQTGPLLLGLWVGSQRRGKSRGLLRVCAPAPFNPKHPVTAPAQL